MGVVSLGAETVKFVDDSSQCPSGTWAKPAIQTWPSIRVGFECNIGEPWYCEMFGIGCKGVIPVQAPSPETKEQLENPLEWTPETMAGQWKAEQDQHTLNWIRATSGIGTALPGEEEIEAAKWAGIGIGTGLLIAGGIALLILLKR